MIEGGHCEAPASFREVSGQRWPRYAVKDKRPIQSGDGDPQFKWASRGPLEACL